MVVYLFDVWGRGRSEALTITYVGVYVQVINCVFHPFKRGEMLLR